MTGKQHMGIGVGGSIAGLVAFTSLASTAVNPVQSVIVVTGSVFGSLMPDIDSKKSKASQVFNKVLFYFIMAFGVIRFINNGKVSTASSTVLAKVVDLITYNSLFSSFGLLLFLSLVVAGKLSPHRGFTHKWLGTLSFCLVALITFESSFAWGFIIGYLLHLVADRCTKDGKYLKFFELRLPCQNSKGKFKPVF